MAILWGTYANEQNLLLTILFALLTILAFYCCYKTWKLARTKHYYKNIIAVRYLLPIVCIVVGLDNGFMFLGKWIFEENSNDQSNFQIVITNIMMALQTIEVPFLLLTTFEVCYLTHKRRSVNFCGMFFDEGHRVILVSSKFRGLLLRNLIRLVAFLLCVMGIIVNFGLGFDEEQMDEFSGKAGWWSVHQCMAKGACEEGILLILLLSLIPDLVLVLCSFYLSIVLWSYGTSSSIVVHSSIGNAWFALFFGTVLLSIGQLFDPDLYPFTSNLGLIFYIASIVLLLKEVDKDMDAADDFATFLDQFKNKTGDDHTEREDDGSTLDSRNIRESKSEMISTKRTNSTKSYPDSAIERGLDDIRSMEITDSQFQEKIEI